MPILAHYIGAVHPVIRHIQFFWNMYLCHFCTKFVSYFSTFVTNQQRRFQLTDQFKANAICNAVAVVQSVATANITSRNEVHCCAHAPVARLVKQTFVCGSKSFK
jgi:hypothetical protein